MELILKPFVFQSIQEVLSDPFWTRSTFKNKNSKPVFPVLPVVSSVWPRFEVLVKRFDFGVRSQS